MGARTDAYDHLHPTLVEYARTSPDDPRHHRLRDDLVAGFHPVARNIAARFARRGEPTEDLEQVAVIGLMNALHRFDPEHGSDFLSYAVPTMMGEVRRYFRDVAWTVRTPRGIKDLAQQVGRAVATLSQDLGRSPTAAQVAEYLGISREQVVEAQEAAAAYRPASLDRTLVDSEDAELVDLLGGVDPDLARVDDRALVGELVASLPAREQRMLTLRFVHEKTQYEIASELGISQMHVSRLLSQTFTLLRERLQADEATEAIAA